MYQIETALEIAIKAHKNQTDRYGKPYILHPLRVMMNVNNDEDKIAAILHDVVEDSDMTCDDLRKEGFSDEIIDAVDCLTKREGEEYFDYINRVLTNSMAIRVKLADLEDNMDLKRIDVITEKDIVRLNKYLKAWRMINEISK